MKIAFVYTGQGAQFPGMANSLWHAFPAFRNRIEEAGILLGEPLEIIMNDAKKMKQTRYAQPALFAYASGITDLLKAQGVDVQGACGLSLGEYMAYYERGVYDFIKGFELILKRSELMDQAATSQATVMVALITPFENVKALLKAFPKWYIANLNLPNQTVIGGLKASLDQVLEKAEALGIRRAVPLETSGAFHTPYMKEAAVKFASYLKYVDLNLPKDDLYLNTTGRQYTSDLKQKMVEHMTQPVQFHGMINVMIENGFNAFVEIGPKPILSGLIKKIDRAAMLYHVHDVESMMDTLEKLRK